MPKPMPILAAPIAALAMSAPIAALAMSALAAVLAMPVPAALAQGQQQQQQAGPQRVGTFQNWTAATHREGGQKVCYAFARATRSEGAPSNRQAPTLTVTHRPGGRDQLALSAGFPLARNAETVLRLGPAEHKSYATVQSNAFFDGTQAVPALRQARGEAVARTPNGRSNVTDAFPLAGFAQAYDAISRECPPERRG